MGIACPYMPSLLTIRYANYFPKKIKAWVEQVRSGMWLLGNSVLVKPSIYKLNKNKVDTARN